MAGETVLPGHNGGTMEDTVLVAVGLRRPSLSTLLQDQLSPSSCHECCLVPSTAAGQCQERGKTLSPEESMEALWGVGTARLLSDLGKFVPPSPAKSQPCCAQLGEREINAAMAGGWEEGCTHTQCLMGKDGITGVTLGEQLPSQS